MQPHRLVYRDVQTSSILPRFSKTRRAHGAAAQRWRDLLKLALGYGLILAVIWSPRPAQRPLYLLAVAWIVLVTCVSFEGWRAMGLRVVRFWRSAWVVGLALLLSAATVRVAHRLGTLHAPHPAGAFLRTFWGYAIWALLQQFLLQDFFLLRLLRLLPNRTAAVLAATAMFALAHVPNPVLTSMTLLWGAAACVLFLRYRNLWMLGIAHAILGICVTISVPSAIHRNMRVGLGYLRYHAHHGPHARLPDLQRKNKDHNVSTQV